MSYLSNQILCAEKIKQLHPDVLTLDVEMPKMNGIEATRIIREKIGYFPIMALSANYDYKRQCLEAGMDYFFEKPCAPSVLLKKIKELTVKNGRKEWNIRK